ncbi:GNAT family N-acetyltransferase [Aquisalinus flavus]|uniref:N-acetyltransferase n=1 Tax=Aquisalinus flavus TaxID=1526572 RepID=A0A8J2Y7R7_9PROT|nr:GNAT family N-acetyltransferase [Aquisalinus flavus]MBD0427964.1 N-acetyltransferase [Aquisalinus flavus]UNE47718.1 N-acetyltransferase [Aquisalinus flavus]GGD05316.1 hypothetical protein GCM10011342_12820 [Aquisalinus flavus]
MIQARTISSLDEVDREHWDALANPADVGDRPYHPFIAWDFLHALEASGSVRPETGWQPFHLLLEEGDTLIGAMPLYVKGHSQGEYVFDYAWADAYERAGGKYYPKLLSAVPFTPVPGPRLLARDDGARLQLASAATQIADKFGVSSLHINFLQPEEASIGDALGLLRRSGQQYHFTNRGYDSFDDFLGELASRKRKNLRKERESTSAQGVEIEWITGAAITDEHLDAFWIFYQDTGSRKWGTPYLTRTFFRLLIERMADRVLLIMARRDGRYIAGALNMIGGDTLYGRYWGCTEHVPFLHFEVCYYQAIDYAIEHGLSRVEAGAQGEHKIARGYEPVETHSVHWIGDENFRTAIARYLDNERAHVEADIDILRDYTPYRKG